MPILFGNTFFEATIPFSVTLIMTQFGDLKEFLEESNIFERRAFLRSFIASIEVDDGHITLNYTLPLPPDNSRQEAVSVLGIVPQAPPRLTGPCSSGG